MLPNTPSDFLPWPGRPEGMHRADAMRIADAVKLRAGERCLAVMKQKFTMSGRANYAESDWLELARFLSDLGVDVQALCQSPQNGV